MRISREDLEAFVHKIKGGKIKIIDDRAHRSIKSETNHVLDMRKPDFEAMLKGIKAEFEYPKDDAGNNLLADDGRLYVKIHFRDPRNGQVIDAIIHYQEGVIEDSATPVDGVAYPYSTGSE